MKKIVKMPARKYSKSSLDERRAYFITKCPELLRLEKMLLVVGGIRLIYTPEIWFVGELLQDGKFFSGELFEIIGTDLTNGNCHGASRAFAEISGGQLFTGYALTKDGYWREHSWSVYNGHYLETTLIPRIKYFGFESTQLMAVV